MEDSELAGMIDKEYGMKCLSAFKMNQGFRAREAGHYRSIIISFQ